MTLEERALDLIQALNVDESELLSAVLSAYQEARTVALDTKKTKDVKELETATRALEKYLEKHEQKTSGEFFKSVAAVHRYLKDMGYKISQSTLYSHIDSKSLLANGGKYYRRDVDRYAENFLTKVVEGSVADRKAAADIEQKNARTEMLNMKLAEMRGQLIQREKVGQEFAARIGTLARDLDLAADNLAASLVGKTSLEIKKLIREQHRYILTKYCRKLECVRGKDEQAV